MWRIGEAAVALLLVGCGRIGFDPLATSGATDDAAPMRPDGTIPTNDGSVDTGCISQIAAGHQHVCVRANDGRVWCWGLSDNHQLGDAFTASRNYPALAPGFTPTPMSIVTGGYHNCFIDAAMNVYCLGANYFGQ